MYYICYVICFVDSDDFLFGAEDQSLRSMEDRYMSKSGHYIDTAKSTLFFVLYIVSFSMYSNMLCI